VQDPKLPVVANVSADYVTKSEEVRSALVLQVSQPVLWEETLYKLADAGVKIFIEIGPGKALSGFVKKTLTQATTLNVYDVASLENTLAYLEEVS
jgi:[acyl-carrier-protein] S-malonyltransferase